MLTTDQDGGNIPGDTKDWWFSHELEIDRRGPERIGFPNDQILDSIEAIGYFPPIEMLQKDAQ